MQQPNAAGRTYEVESRAYHAARPGFRIVEIQIGPTQTIPWHYHSQARDTFYVLSGSIRVRMRAHEAQVVLTPGESCTVPAARPHSVENAGATSAVFLILQEIGEHDFVPLDCQLPLPESANGMVRPCSCPASDKLARGAKTRSTPWLPSTECNCRNRHRYRQELVPHRRPR